MTNVAKLGERLAVRLHGSTTPALGFITHVNENDADGRASVDVIAFPAGELHPQVATGVPLYESQTEIDDQDETPAVVAFWPADDTGSDAKPPKAARKPATS